MDLKQTIDKEQLVKDGVYRLYHKGVKKELAVFCHIGQTGMPIFHPLGEPSFQDIFGLSGKDWVFIFERMGNKEDLGYE
jgi:hypothetical protein